jgi:hypothetical protein
MGTTKLRIALSQGKGIGWGTMAAALSMGYVGVGEDGLKLEIFTG